MDSHLALSKSVDENEFIAVEVGRPESRVWIGLRRSEGEFVWSDGSKSDFTNWGRFEPKDASVVGRDCVSLLPEDIFYSWEVRNCDDRQAFICERGKKTAIFNTKAIQTSVTTSGVFIHRYACAGKRHQRWSLSDCFLISIEYSCPNSHFIFYLTAFRSCPATIYIGISTMYWKYISVLEPWYQTSLNHWHL